uniref:Uncharacterized protein n=1 Tax=Pyxicephalus adspersus TaxID=30357 RepID=A0AAV2ZSK8_PYXAD|nr:TPA: hypothetical protein GDO54_004783 [Pyxicephalus adspersus]
MSALLGTDERWPNHAMVGVSIGVCVFQGIKNIMRFHILMDITALCPFPEYFFFFFFILGFQSFFFFCF